MSLSLGIDVGTSGVRSAVIDEKGNVLAMARADHLPQDVQRIDAELWWQAAKTCIQKQIKNLADRGYDAQDIARICVDGTSGTMVLVDEALKPVTRAHMYNSKGFEIEAASIARHAPETHITNGSASALARPLYLEVDRFF